MNDVSIRNESDPVLDITLDFYPDRVLISQLEDDSDNGCDVHFVPNDELKLYGDRLSYTFDLQVSKGEPLIINGHEYSFDFCSIDDFVLVEGQGSTIAFSREQVAEFKQFVETYK